MSACKGMHLIHFSLPLPCLPHARCASRSLVITDPCSSTYAPNTGHQQGIWCLVLGLGRPCGAMYTGAVSMPAPDTVMVASKAYSMCLVSCRPGWSHGGLGRAATGAWLASCLQGRSTGTAWPCPSVPSPIPPVFLPVFGNSENVSCNSELMQKRAVTYWPSRFWEVMLLGVNMQSFIISTVPSVPMAELAVPTLQERPEISSERPKSCLGYSGWLKERQTASNSCWSAFRPDDRLEYTQFSLWIQNILL